MLVFAWSFDGAFNVYNNAQLIPFIIMAERTNETYNKAPQSLFVESILFTFSRIFLTICPHKTDEDTFTGISFRNLSS